MKQFISLVIVVLGLLYIAYANTPGGHNVVITWTDSTCVSPSCTFNIYRSLTAGSCGTGKTPFATGITIPQYEDDTVVAGTSYYYAVTAYPATGGESSCSTELQLSVSSSSGSTPTLPSGQAH